MPQVNFTNAVQLAGLSIQGTMPRSGEGQLSYQPLASVAAGKSGTLSTRTDDNTGVLTLGSGHGITDGQKISIGWSGGYRYNVTVGTVSGTSVPIDLGSGDNLPAATTAVVVSVETVAPFAFAGNNLVGIAISASQRTAVRLQESGGTIHLAADIPTGEAYQWFTGFGSTNPVAGDTIDEMVFANLTTSSLNFAAGALLDT